MERHYPPHLKVISLDGSSLSLARAAAIANGAEILIAHSVWKRMEAARLFFLDENNLTLEDLSMTKNELKRYQENLIKSHAAGFGDALSIEETRLAMALRINVFVKGHSGVRFELCEALLNLIHAEIYPLIPEYGSMGASGDQIPLSHLALPLLGLGMVSYQGKKMTAAQALKKARLAPIALAEKEGHCLIHGTQIMLAVGTIALSNAIQTLSRANKIAALTFEALEGFPDSLHPLLHEQRNQEGQMRVAAELMKELTGSFVFREDLRRERTQDTYSIRCIPQVHGSCLDALNYAVQVIEKELNASTDDPLIFPEQQLILRGGNFHDQSLSLAFDFAALAMAEIANVSEKRLEQLLHYLALQLGNDESGYMALQNLGASLTNEIHLLANPASTDAISNHLGIEDYVSMGMTSARKLKKIVRHTNVILALEWIAAAQAIDLRQEEPLGEGTGITYCKIREALPKLVKDRVVADDIEKAVVMFENL